LDELYTIFRKRLVEIGRDNIALIVQKPETSILLNTDKIRFMQVLINLLSNAIKFTDKGHIQFGISEIAEKQVTFFVSDTGSGIKREFLPSIFERFRQADDSSTRRHGGTGLGMSIVKNLVELMDGHITLESEEGKGTVVRFSLPVGPSEGN
jgi:two-component system sensor histidine kinase EvgS